MNNKLMIAKLKNIGIKFDKGLTKEQIEKLETLCNFKFPNEIKQFLKIAVPIGDLFYNYNDLSEKNIKRINDFQKNIEDAFVFDIEHNNLLEMFRKSFQCKNDNELRNEIFKYLRRSSKLIPFLSESTLTPIPKLPGNFSVKKLGPTFNP
jgi:hypothetical protein